VLTIMDGEIVFAQDAFSEFAPPPLPVEPDWSPVTEFGGAYRLRKVAAPGGGGGGSGARGASLRVAVLTTSGTTAGVAAAPAAGDC
jgi:hypothetical protein